MRVWYRVRDLAAARNFYTEKLGFTETYLDADGGWAKLERGQMRIALAEGERLRSDDVEVGTVLEIHNEVRLLDVFDPDGNRVQLVQQLRSD